MNFDLLAKTVVATSVFVLLGLAMFGLAFFVIAKLAPFSMKKEIADDQNIALAILIGSVILGISLIIAAAIHG